MIRRRLLRRASTEVNCHEVGKVLQSYLDGEVEPGFAAKIAAHLEKCKDCGLEYETYSRIKSSLNAHEAHVDAEAVDRLREFGRKLTSD